MQPPAQAPAAPPSTMLKAGSILLLVGAILSAAVGAFLLIGAVAFAAIGENVVGDGESELPFAVVGVLYGVLGVLLAIGSVLGFLAYGRARAGDARGAWGRGLAASLLPPLQIIPLVGAILCLVSPEGEAQKAQRQRPAQVP